MQSVIGGFEGPAPTGSSTGGVMTTGFSAKLSNAVLSAVFSMLVVGTGGSAHARMINPGPSGPIAIPIILVADGNIDSDRLLDTHEKLAGIRRYLSMSVTDMAKVLHVRRPTIYAWLRNEPSLRAEHMRRLEAIYKNARAWRAISSKPVGEFLSRPLTPGPTLLALLWAKKLDEAAIASRFLQIHEALSRSPGRVTVLEAAEKHGLKLSARKASNWASNEEIDI
jgi:transcriptional regulator with XRE-family HTH domain